MNKKKDEVKEEKNKKWDKKKNKDKKGFGKKKFVVIGLIILAVVIVGGILGYIFYNSNKSVGSKWGDKYFNFVKDVKNGDKKGVKFEENSFFEFIEIPNVEDPVMVFKTEENENNNVDIYYIDGEDVLNVVDLGFEDIKFLYNIEDKKYNWYGYSKSDTEEKYISISSDMISNKKQDNKDDESSDEKGEYTFKINEEVVVSDGKGKNLSMPKFDTVFVQANPSVTLIKFSESLSDEELESMFTSAVSEYKDFDNVVSKDEKKVVENKLEEINSKKEEMTKLEEEVKKQKEEEARRAEEARKKAEEEAKKGLSINNHRIKYGTYKGIAGEPSEGCSITINADRTFSAIDYNGSQITGTYKIGQVNFAQDIVPDYVEAMTFYKSNGEMFKSLTAWSDTVIGDNDIFSYKYAG